MMLLTGDSSEYMQTKSFCEDITEGKFSFPIIHAVQSRPDDKRLLNILRQRTEELDVKRYAVQWMNQLGSVVYTREVIPFLPVWVPDFFLTDILLLGSERAS
jgi:geranylgeranyl diphosphate synthase type 3